MSLCTLKLRIGTASRKSGMSTQTPTRWRKKGLIKAERVGENGHWVFDIQDAVACSFREVEEQVSVVCVERIGIMYA